MTTNNCNRYLNLKKMNISKYTKPVYLYFISGALIFIAYSLKDNNRNVFYLFLLLGVVILIYSFFKYLKK